MQKWGWGGGWGGKGIDQPLQQWQKRRTNKWKRKRKRERERDITDGDGFDIISYYLKPYSHLQGESISGCFGFHHISKWQIRCSGAKSQAQFIGAHINKSTDENSYITTVTFTMNQQTCREEKKLQSFPNLKCYRYTLWPLAAL